MSALDVARKDFLDVRRARVVWAVGGAYTLLTVLFFLQVRFGDVAGAPPVVLALWNVAFVGAVFVPAIALVAAYLAIAGERESGSVKHLLSTPASRRDVVLGKYASRAAIVAVALAVAFLVAAALTVAWFGALHAGVFLGIAALTTVYALAYVAMAIGISAVTATRSRAMLGALGVYFSTNLMTLNENVSGLAGIEFVLNELLGLGVDADAIQFVGMVTNPTRAYLVSTLGVFPGDLAGEMGLPDPSALAWYVQPGAAVVVLLAWLVVPILVGLHRFERTDIS